MLNIDHDIKEEFMKIVGYRNTSKDIEEYMKSVVEESKKVKTMVEQGNTNYNSSECSQLSIGLKLDVLNATKAELNAVANNISDVQTLSRVRDKARMLEAVVKTRLGKLRNG